jgi:prevent-host-death family protein
MNMYQAVLAKLESEDSVIKEAVIRASELYRSGGKVLRRVAVGKESFIVESNGYPIVALLPYAEYEEFKRERARLEADKFMAEQQVISEKLGVDKAGDDVVMADALQAVEETRRSKRKKQ